MRILLSLKPFSPTEDGTIYANGVVVDSTDATATARSLTAEFGSFPLQLKLHDLERVEGLAAAFPDEVLFPGVCDLLKRYGALHVQTVDM